MQSKPLLSVLNNEQFRKIAFQILTVVGVVAIIWIAWSNTMANLSRQGIASGFGFLNSTAGFEVAMSMIPYTEESSYGSVFVVALLNTLLVSVLGIIAASILGFLLGVSRLSSNWLLSKISGAYVETVRNIPLLLQIFFWYFAVLRTLPSPRQSVNVADSVFLNIRGLYLPKPEFGSAAIWYCAAVILAGVGYFLLRRIARIRQEKTGTSFSPFKRITLILTVVIATLALAVGSPATWSVPALQGFNFVGGFALIPELVALWVSLSIYTAAFIGEIVRAGILAVPKGQSEAAAALGLKRSQALRLIIIPQAMRVIIPPLTSQYLNLTKNSSLAAAIAYPDLVLVFAGTVLMQTGQAVEVIGITMAVYLVISLSISMGMNIFNRKMALVER